MDLAESYAHCESLARRSGSSFFRSFSLLSAQRRNAMMALYAFARLADDATDGTTHGSTGHKTNNSSHFGEPLAWSSTEWHEWLDEIALSSGTVGGRVPNSLSPIRLALGDSIQRFAIPIKSLHDIVKGVDMDSADQVRFETWQETKTYCHRVASSVGIACLAIWSKQIGEPPHADLVRAALDCGVAFQMTNILRDVAEDAHRGRIYLPMQDLQRFGVDTQRWVGLRQQPTLFAVNEIGDWRGLIRIQLERAKALYENGWEVANSISLDGQRMFSLMWHSYRALLSRIEEKPELIWQSRIRLPNTEKLQLIGQHAFTPWFQRLIQERRERVKVRCVSESKNVTPNALEMPRVAVVGGGLAGINAALHLSRHGCKVSLIESKNRIGGRVGSFQDVDSGQSIDYCQHVGMKCCTRLQQWIDDTDQSPFWTEQDALHFVSSTGKKIRVSAWPIPAPLHLCGLLFRWPQLNVADRLRVAYGLFKLQRLSQDDFANSRLAIDWLRANGQNDRCIRNFWTTILVSALGEQVERVTLGAAHKVLVDGFSASRTAFHLLVPNRPLSELLEKSVFKRLDEQGVSIRLGQAIDRIEQRNDGTVEIAVNSKEQNSEIESGECFDAVVCAVPWNKAAWLFSDNRDPGLESANALESSPITGIHTWWDRAWLKEPHAILIDRLCHWVFPAPERSTNNDALGSLPHLHEHYYQIVISGSRNLPRGDNELVLKMVKQDLAELFPESAVASLLRGRVVTDPNSVFSVSVGHEASRLPVNLLAHQCIWLAGDWTDTGWPATMEGALISGELAAEGVLRYFARDADLSIAQQ